MVPRHFSSLVVRNASVLFVLQIVSFREQETFDRPLFQFGMYLLLYQEDVPGNIGTVFVSPNATTHKMIHTWDIRLYPNDIGAVETAGCL